MDEREIAAGRGRGAGAADYRGRPLARGNARKPGTCAHRAGLRRGEVEELILDLLRERLLAPGTVQTFVAGYTEELNRDRAGASSRRVEQEQQLSRLERKLQGLYDAIAEGLRTPGLLAQLQQLEAEREWPLVLMAEAEPTPVRLHPNLAYLYRQKVARQCDALA